MPIQDAIWNPTGIIKKNKEKKKTPKKRTFVVPVMTVSTFAIKVCPRCGRPRSTNHINGYCDICKMCSMCSERPWVEITSNLCEECLCQTCGGSQGPMGYDDDGNKACGKCLDIKICKSCTSRYADTFIRGEKSPSYCSRCAPRRAGRCFFCNGKATDVLGKETRQNTRYYVVCTICRGTSTCFDKGCTPVRNCPNCKMRNRDRETAESHPTPRWNAAVPWMDNPVKFWDGSKTMDRKSNRSKRFLGVEIEVAGCTNPSPEAVARFVTVLNKWSASCVYDGSLQHGGFEVTLSPASGDLFLKQVDEVTDALQKLGAYVNEQCGLHVHVDARDHHYSDLRKLIRYYAYLEPAILRTQPYDRIMKPNPHNGKYYCAPCGDMYLKGLSDTSQESVSKMYTSVTREKVFTNIYGADAWRPPRREHYANAKYHACNFHSFFYKDRKTVEARMHSGTIVPRKIKDWGMLWASIVDDAYRMNDKQVPDKGPVQDALDQLIRIAPTTRIKTYVQSRFDQFREKYDRHDEQNKPMPAVDNDPMPLDNYEQEHQYDEEENN